MTERTELNRLKTVAKRVARARRIAHHQALDLLAKELHQPHWRAVTVAWKKGWRPELSQWESAELLLLEITPPKNVESGSNFPAFLLSEETQGSIDGHDYTLSVASEVHMTGRGWTIVVGEAPSEAPQLEIDRRIKNNPILNLDFSEKALAVAHAAAGRLRARIAADWPRRSTKPDAEGRALHPLRAQLSNKWHCLHCDGASSGAQIAGNMWHCPTCSATPIEIFPEPFWKAAA
jgi:hypothetical protein